jgi:hypothetical protein
MPDGSIPDEAVALLREIGQRMAREGMPGEAAAAQPER